MRPRSISLNFLAKFNVAARYNAWTDDDKAAFLTTALIGQAANLLFQYEGATYDEIIGKLRGYFGSAYQLKKYRLELKSRKKKTTETYHELALDVERITTMAYPDINSAQRDVLATDAFTEAVENTTVKYLLLEKEPATLREAATMATNLEFLYKSKEQARDHVRPRQVWTTQADPSTQQQSQKPSSWTPTQKKQQEDKGSGVSIQDTSAAAIADLIRQATDLLVTLSNIPGEPKKNPPYDFC